MMLLAAMGAQWGVNIVIVSVVSFMHFQLDHGLNIIDEWIHYYGWPLVTIIKMIALWGVFKWLSARQATSTKNLFKQTWGESSPESFVLTVFVLLCVAILGLPKYNNLKSLEIVFSSINFICVVVFFTSDFLILCAFKKDGRYSNLTLFLTGLMMITFIFLSNRYVYRIFNYHEETTMMLLLVALVLCAWSQFTLKNVYIFFVTCLAPMIVLLGVDPIHDMHFSIFELRRPLDGVFQLVICSLALTYLIIKDKRRRLMMDIKLPDLH